MWNNLRFRLTVISIGLAIGPLLLVGAVLTQRSLTLQRAQALELQSHLAQRVSTQVGAFIRERESELRVINKIWYLLGLDHEQQTRLLSALLFSQSVYKELVLLDNEGQEQVRVSRTKTITTADLGNRSTANEFVVPKSSGETYYSPVRFDEVTGEPFMTIAIPLFDLRTGAVGGVLMADFRFKTVWNLIADVQASGDETVYVVDDQGRVVAHRNPSVVLAGTPFDLPDQDGVHTGLSGRDVVLAVARIQLGGQELAVVAEKATSKAFQLAIQTVYITSSIIVLALVVAVGLGVLAVRQIVQPVETLATVARSIMAGDLSRQADVVSRDEIGDLAEAFNSMTAQLRQSLKDLEQRVVDLKRTEGVLAHERDLLDALMDNVPDTIYFKDAACRFTRINRAQAQVLGVNDPEEVIGKTDFDFFTEGHARDAYTDEQEIVKSGQPLIDKTEEIRRADGQFRWVSATKVPIMDKEGQVTGIVGISRDITERKQAEEALRESEERYRQSQENTPNPVLFVDREGIIQMWNRACEQIFQYKAEEIIGQAYHKLLWDPKDRPAVEAMLAQVWQGHSLSDKDMTYRCKDGTQRFMVSRLYPLRDHEGHVQGCVLTNTDITERKRLEEQLRQAQKMEAIGTLAGGIAHDFNNILTGILGFASVVHAELPTDSPWHSDVETIIRSAQRGSELTRQLLTFARRGMIEVHPLNLNDVAHEVLRLLERTIDKAIAIEPYLSGDLATVEGNTGQLHQMLLNLCLNARDAMPQGGRLIIETQNVALSKEKAHTELDLETGQYVLLSVTDTGIGMNAETRQRLFEPFFTTKERGRGLGLAMVYGIVRGHGGAIHAYSEPGQGSTFKVYLPVAGRLAEDTALPEEVQVVGGTETVLVVDDEEPVRALLQRILKEGGYTVMLATNGVEAIDVYSRLSAEIDLVVLDIIMPQMGGLETYERLREINPKVKVLLSSGYSENGQAQDILAAGARGFLQKPYDLRAVLHKVRGVLDVG